MVLSEARAIVASEVPADSATAVYTIREVGELIALGPWAVRRLIAQGELPFVKLGRRILVAVEDVDPADPGTKKQTNPR